MLVRFCQLGLSPGYVPWSFFRRGILLLKLEKHLKHLQKGEVFKYEDSFHLLYTTRLTFVKSDRYSHWSTVFHPRTVTTRRRQRPRVRPEELFILTTSYLLTNKRSFKGGSSKIDILICTPGRLMDHIHGTPNFTLQHLRFLVRVFSHSCNWHIMLMEQ